jgi:exopolysaccharide production protein ExoQ
MKRLEWLFHMLAFALQCGAIVPLLLRTTVDDSGLGQSNPINTIATASVLTMVVILMLCHPRTVFRLAPGMWPVLCITLLAILSVVWSQFPGITMRRSASLLTVTLWAWYVTARYDLGDVISIIRQTTALLAVASLAIGILAPSMGQDSSFGVVGWQGVFGSKNDLGMVMAIGAITHIYAILGPRRRFLSYLVVSVGLLLCLAALYLSESRTAWLIGMLGPVLCLLIQLTHKRVGVAIIIWTATILLLAPALVIATDELGTIAQLLGRDATLTGRVDLWLILPSYIEDRLWLGHGFAAFWVTDNLDVSSIWNTIGWRPPHAHNGWLDVLLELGVTGLTLVVIQLLLVFGKGVRAVVEGHEPHAPYLLLMTFVLMIYNLAESNLVRPSVMWMLLVVAAAALTRISRERSARAAPRVPAPWTAPRPLRPSRI